MSADRVVRHLLEEPENDPLGIGPLDHYTGPVEFNTDDDRFWGRNVQALNAVQEALDAPDPDPDAPEANIERHTADMDIHTVMANLGFTDSRTVGANWDGWTKQVGNKQWRIWPTTSTNVYGVTRMERPAKYVQVGRGRRFGQWSDKGHFTCHVTELNQQLREEGALNPPPVDEELVPDPDSPEANIERHTADLDVKAVLTKLGFTHHNADKRQNPERWTLSKGNEMVVVLPTKEAYVYTVCLLTKRPELNGHAIEHDRLNLHLTKIGRHLRSLNLLSEALGVPDPDAPEPNIERFAQHAEQTEHKLDAAINNAVGAFENAIEMQGVNNARRADELAAEIGAEWAEKAGYPNGSDEFDWIVSAVNNAAGEAFPGDWALPR